MFSILPAFCAVILLSLASPGRLSAQDAFGPDSGIIKDINPTDVIHWEVVGGQSLPGQIVEIGLRLTSEQEFTLYRDKVSFFGPTGFTIKKIIAPPTTQKPDPMGTAEVPVYVGGDFIVQFQGLDDYREKTFPLKVRFLGCTARICLLPYTQSFEVSMDRSQLGPPGNGTASEENLKDAAGASITGQAEGDATGGGDAEADASGAAGGGSAGGSASLEEEWAQKLKSGGFSLWMLFIVVFLGGLFTNLTPCVAPMIPITLRLLANQNFSPMVNASLYASGILVTYTALGSVATMSGTAFGTFMSSVPLNIAFALLMLILGMTMIGFGNLTFLQTLGSRIGTGKPSARNTFLMGAAAGLVAAPCTGPILGALLAYTAGNGNPGQSIALMFTYSLGFSLPYVLLGSAAGKSSKMRVSPLVQVAIKIIFAGVMFGLCFYYLRVPAYAVFKNLNPWWPKLTTVGLVAGAALCVYCIARATHNKYVLALPAAFLGFGLFAGAQWLTHDTSAGGDGAGFTEYHSEEEAFAKAQATGKPILMDNWAEWCEACKKMDVTTFKDPQVIKELSENWIVAKLDLTESNDKNDKHLEKYGIQGLPTLVLVWPTKGTKKSNIVGFVSAAGLLNQLSAFKE